MPDDVRQFKVYLPAELIREIKYHAVDTEQSLSSIAATALRQHLQAARQDRQDRHEQRERHERDERREGESMRTRGVEGLIIQTRNWGKTVAFWQALGYQVEFETGRNSGRLEHPAGGPYLFIVERPDPHPEIQPLVAISDTGGFEPPPAGTVEQPFTDMHWGAAQMLLRDPDGRHVSIQAPLSPPRASQHPNPE
jgi:DNA-binding LacI/PurR family transcriptional regulator